MSAKDVCKNVKIISPTLWHCISILDALIFFCILPFAFLAGAIWTSIKNGFMIGRDWG